MNTILNAKEAFEALQNRKTVLCRYAGDGTLPGDKDFSSLDQMPATVFVKPHYEFCIKIETMELAGITFTKPMTLEEYIDGQEVYVLSTYPPSIYVFNFKTAALIESIESGFVQRDAENAKLQLAAISKALGREISEEIKITRLGEEPKKQRTRKNNAEVHAETKAKEPPSLLVRIQKAADLTELDALEIDVSARDERIQPTLMAEVNKRRKQLEAPIDLLDEAFQ